MISAGQEKGVSQCGQPSAPNSGFSGSKGGQLNWSWASELTAMLPDALKNLYNEGLAGLEARLRRAFEGLSPEQEVNIEAKLMAALEREKQAAVAREDYIQADYYKVEIDALIESRRRKPTKNWTKAHSFARAASFMAHTSKGKGKGKGREGKGKGKDKDCGNQHFDSPKGKGKGYIGLDDLAKGKGKGFFSDSFDLSKADGRGAVNDSFARRERAMNVAVETAHSGSFATDGGVAGSFFGAPPSLTFQREAFGDKASFAAPRHDPTFSAGMPRSAAGTGQPQLPVCASFANTTTRPTESSNTQLASSSSFSGPGCTTQRSSGHTTQRRCGGSFHTYVPSSGSFACPPTEEHHKPFPGMAVGRSKSGLPTIIEF